MHGAPWSLAQPAVAVLSLVGAGSAAAAAAAASCRTSSAHRFSCSQRRAHWQLSLLVANRAVWPACVSQVSHVQHLHLHDEPVKRGGGRCAADMCTKPSLSGSELRPLHQECAAVYKTLKLRIWSFSQAMAGTLSTTDNLRRAAAECTAAIESGGPSSVVCCVRRRSHCLQGAPESPIWRSCTLPQVAGGAGTPRCRSSLALRTCPAAHVQPPPLVDFAHTIARGCSPACHAHLSAHKGLLCTLQL